MKTSKNDSGSGLVEVILIVATVNPIGFISYAAYKNHDKAVAVQTATSTASPTDSPAPKPVDPYSRIE